MPQDGKKTIFDRIQSTENCFGDLCSELSSFAKKKARLRDKYDELARMFKGFADTVRFNETLFNGLLNYSKSCTQLADIKDVEVQRLQAKTLHDLASYENRCKIVRESLKHSLLQHGKEQLRQRNQQRNTDQNTGTNEESNPNNEFENNFLKFERQKLTDVRRILMDLTLIQLKESVKSVELLTTMYNDVASIDVDKDLEEIEQKLFNREPNSLKPNNRSQSMSSLATNNTAQRLKRTNLSKSTTSLSSPSKDIIESHARNGKMPSSGSESNDEDDDNDDTVTKTSEESSDSEAAHSDGSSQTKPSSSQCTDDDSVQIRQLKEPPSIKPQPEPRKRTAPTPQVRFSKIVNHIK